MPVTITRTATKTFARLELLKYQVLVALRRTVPFEEWWRAAMEKGLDNQWIQTVHVYGLDGMGLARASLVLEINWAEYSLQLQRGRATVTINDQWVDDTALEVDEAIYLFNQYIREVGLDTKWLVVYSPGLDIDEINRILGFTRCDNPVWAGEQTGITTANEQLPELQIGIFLVDE